MMRTSAGDTFTLSLTNDRTGEHVSLPGITETTARVALGWLRRNINMIVAAKAAADAARSIETFTRALGSTRGRK
jgi:hypothetical protein